MNAKVDVLQVDKNGRSWRSGAKVIQRELRQWFLKITAFKEALLEDLNQLAPASRWPEQVLSMQKHWIGKSVGMDVQFGICVGPEESLLKVFTTRLDTLFGVQYLAVSLAHPLVFRLAKSDEGLLQFLKTIPELPLTSKAGYLLKGVHASNPLLRVEKIMEHSSAPAIGRQLPVFVAPYVVDSHGGGAVMGVPAHDRRDFAFWEENGRGEPVRPVIGTQEQASSLSIEEGLLNSECGPCAGLTSAEALGVLLHYFKDVFGSDGSPLVVPGTRWRLRDWLISRQRSWGTPIPIIHCIKCGPVPVPRQDLPVRLPEVRYREGLKGNPLEHAEDWLNVRCPTCCGPARRETDTMDTFMDSSWYYLRYMSRNQHASSLQQMALDFSRFMPVDIYVGGIEHAILHLLYARFISKFLSGIGVWPSGAEHKGEPFRRLISQGMVKGRTYVDPDTARFLGRDDVLELSAGSAVVKSTNKPAKMSYEKMSKSKHNGVDPIGCIKLHGSDATRAHMMFLAPVNEEIDWEEQKIVGVKRWLGRIWRTTQVVSSRMASVTAEAENENSTGNDRLREASRDAISRITTTLESSLSLNTIVSDLQKMSNALEKGIEDNCSSLLVQKTLSCLLRMLAPICPGVAQECWHTLFTAGAEQEEYVASATWPQLSEIGPILDASKSPGVPLFKSAIQTDGKLRAVLDLETLPISVYASEEAKQKDVLAAIRKSPGGLELVEKYGLNLARRTVVIKGGKTINFVIGT